MGDDKSRGWPWPSATQAESCFTKSPSENSWYCVTTSWSSKEISTLCLAHPRFHPPTALYPPPTAQKTPHFELAQRPRKSRFSLTVVSVSPSFSVTSCRVVLPACRKSKLTFSILPASPLVRVGARTGTTTHPSHRNVAATSATDIATAARRGNPNFVQLSNALGARLNSSFIAILLIASWKARRGGNHSLCKTRFPGCPPRDCRGASPAKRPKAPKSGRPSNSPSLRSPYALQLWVAFPVAV